VKRLLGPSGEVDCTKSLEFSGKTNPFGGSVGGLTVEIADLFAAT
jgi:hypothetical protein